MRIKGFVFGLVFCFVCLNVAAQRGGELEGAHNVEVFPQLGHTDLISAVDYSPDGKYITSASRDRTIKLWDAVTGRELRTYSGHSESVTSVSFSPDGKTIISGSHDGTIKLWETDTGREIRSITVTDSWVFSAVFSPNGSLVASGSWEQIKIWDIASGRNIRTFTVPDQSIGPVVFSPDGRHIISGQGNTIKLWDIATGWELRTFSGRLSSSKALSPDGRQIVSVLQDNSLKLWDVITGREIRNFSGVRGNEVTSVTFSQDGRYVAGVCYESGTGSITIWETITGREVRTITGFFGNYSGIYSIVFSPDGKNIIAGTGDAGYGIIVIYDVASGQKIRTLSGYLNSSDTAAFHPSGNIIATSAGNSIFLWDTVIGRINKTLINDNNIHDDNYLRVLSFNSNGNQILCRTGKWMVNLFLWDIDTGCKTNVTLSRTNEMTRSLAYSSDWKQELTRSALGGEMVFWAGSAMTLFDGETGNDIRTFSELQDKSTETVISAAFSPDQRHIVSGSIDGKVRLWDKTTGRVLRAFTGHTDYVSSVIFSPDGRQIISGSENSIKIWETATGREIRTFTGNPNGVHHTTYNHSGSQIITVSNDRKIKLWDVSTGLEIRTFIGHVNNIFSIAFSPDDKKIISASADGTVRLWDVASGREIAQFISFKDGEWIVITPDGFYNASPNGDKYLNVRVGNNVYGIDQYRHTFYRPQIVEARLQGRPDPVNQLPVIQQAGEPPVVTILSPQNNTRVNVNQIEVSGVIESNQPIRNMRVQLNGRLVSGNEMRGMRGVRSGDLEATGIFLSQPQNRLEFSFNLDLVPGNNHIEIIANNPNESRSSITVFRQQSTTQQAAIQQNVLPNLWILSIGVNRYDSPQLTNLNFAVNDAREIINAFREQEGRVYQRVNSRLIADGTPILPTRENILDGFDFLRRASPTDDVVLFIAGHGLLDQNGNFFFMPSNASFTDDGAIRSANVISSRDIQTVLNAPGQKIVFIDACHSAGINSNLIRIVDNDRLVRDLESYGSVIMASSKGNQFSQERSDLRHGVFSYSIIQGLRGAANNYNGVISMASLYAYVTNRVKELTNNEQEPAFSTPGYTDFPVAKPR